MSDGHNGDAMVNSLKLEGHVDVRQRYVKVLTCRDVKGHMDDEGG